MLAFQFFYILRIDWTQKAKEANEFAVKDQESKDIELDNAYFFTNPNFDYSNNNEERNNVIIKSTFKERKIELIIKFIVCLSILLILCLSVYVHESNFVKIDLTSISNITNSSIFKYL